MEASRPPLMIEVWYRDRRPPFLSVRSSKAFIGFTACVAAFTEGFLNSAIVPVLPFSLVARSGVAEKDVQLWLSVLLVVFGGTMTLAAPIAGWATDLSSTRQLPFLGSLALAFISTLLFCLATAPWVLVVARAFQGVAGSIIYTAGLALVADSVRSDEVGSWVGFVLSGMTFGNLIAPWLAGIVYKRAGYYAVFYIIIGIIAFDFVLRVMMIETRTAAKWLRAGIVDPSESETVNAAAPDAINANDTVHDFHSSSTDVNSQDSDHTWQEPDEGTSLLPHSDKPPKTWHVRTFPRLSLLLGSPRMMAATYGAFAHTMLISFFDATLPLLVKRKFGWDSRGAGLIFLTTSIPSLFGTLFGALSDRYGTRKVSLAGFLILVPSLLLLGLVTHDSVADIVILCIFLVLSGFGMTAILSPLAADMFHEVQVLAEEHPVVFGKSGAFAQAYSLFNGALGLSTVLGASTSGFFYEKTNWPITVSVMAFLTAMVAVQVARYTGRHSSSELEIDGSADQPKDTNKNRTLRNNTE